MTNSRLLPTGTFSLGKTNATYVFVLVQGIVLGLVGMAHGIFAASQGNTPTGGYYWLSAFYSDSQLSGNRNRRDSSRFVRCNMDSWIYSQEERTDCFPGAFDVAFVAGGGIAQVPFLSSHGQHQRVSINHQPGGKKFYPKTRENGWGNGG